MITLRPQDVCADMPPHNMVPAEGAYPTWYAFGPSSNASIDAKQTITGYNSGRPSLDF